MSRPPSAASNAERRRSPSPAGSDYGKIDIRIRQPPKFTRTYPDNTSTAFDTWRDEVEDYFIIKKIPTAHQFIAIRYYLSGRARECLLKQFNNVKQEQNGRIQRITDIAISIEQLAHQIGKEIITPYA
ncbi:hypothetical protein EX30DRAFT_375723 [Ascodesmis nigricans]|uniref:Uncharacterized protein n=1 Tax=Ascodesmis nigricans TaxID=341454 RepID=A0A4S2MPB4_9PEZI|nr:hypothetical protein EX30DRAFT_375723 [Ascodesmis nigricans]